MVKTLRCYCTPVSSGAAAVSRRRLLESSCERRALLLPAHLPARFGAYVDAAGSGFKLRWLDADASAARAAAQRVPVGS